MSSTVPSPTAVQPNPVMRTLFHVHPNDPEIKQDVVIAQLAATRGIPPDEILVVDSPTAAIEFVVGVSGWDRRYALYVGALPRPVSRQLEKFVGRTNCALNGLDAGRLYNYYFAPSATC